MKLKKPKKYRENNNVVTYDGTLLVASVPIQTGYLLYQFDNDPPIQIFPVYNFDTCTITLSHHPPVNNDLVIQNFDDHSINFTSTDGTKSFRLFIQNNE